MFSPDEYKDFPKLEDAVNEFWQKNKIFEKSIDQKDSKNAYVFYDGPPFISGLPHYGHLLGSIAKDVIPRFWTMKGKRVERVWGWDAHGLTVENKVQKKLNIPDRRSIENFGLEEFVKECYTYTSEVSSEWKWYIDKIGRWVDMAHAYKTIDQDYMESVIWAFKQLYDKGFIYEGIRTSLFCTTCGTPVSNFEVAMDNSYKDMEDPSIIVKFKVTTAGEFENAFILAWTTTPWTIPSNRALVIEKSETYCLVEVNDEKLILAKKRLNEILKSPEFSAKVIREFLGDELIGLKYEPPFKFFTPNDKDFFVYHFDGMVTMEEGTGIVHSAPGFGEVDSKMGVHYGLTMMFTIDDEGKFIKGDNENNPFEGMYYKKANNYILEELEKSKLLFFSGTIVHRFPYHDRCNTPLIQRAQNSWFFNIQKLKEKLLKENSNINWIPSHLKEGRFAQGIEQAPDWCLSRARFWATPMPVWKSEDGELIVVGSIKELEDLSGQKVENLHRPYIDQIKINKDGKEYARVPEVLDSWFEAGSMPWAQIHYPFENQETFERNFPGDYIVEYIAQVRAWFYVMHVLSCALFDTNSFKNVITTGVMAGNDGRKMSKTYGNYTDPKDVLENVGGDALRLYLMGSPLMVGENANFDDIELKNKSKSVLNLLWNSLKFFMTYARTYDFKATNCVSENILDKWILLRLSQTGKAVDTALNSYTVPDAVRNLESFVDDLSKWYIRRSRDGMSSGNLETLNTAFWSLLRFSKVSAPLIPFISEAIYQNLSEFSGYDFKESVHLDNWENFDNLSNNELEIIAKMGKTREVVTEALAARDVVNIKVRQPLNSVTISSNDVYADLIKDEVNVHEVIFDKNIQGVVLDTNITENLEMEGLAREMIRTFQGLRKDAGLNVSDKIKATYQSGDKAKKVLEVHGDMIKNKIGAIELSEGMEYTVSKA